MSMPETGFFSSDSFQITHPEYGELKIHLNGRRDMERTSSAPRNISLLLKSGTSSLSVDLGQRDDMAEENCIWRFFVTFCEGLVVVGNIDALRGFHSTHSPIREIR